MRKPAQLLIKEIYPVLDLIELFVRFSVGLLHIGYRSVDRSHPQCSEHGLGFILDEDIR